MPRIIDGASIFGEQEEFEELQEIVKAAQLEDVVESVQQTEWVNGFGQLTQGLHFKLKPKK